MELDPNQLEPLKEWELTPEDHICIEKLRADKHESIREPMVQTYLILRRIMAEMEAAAFSMQLHHERLQIEETLKAMERSQKFVNQCKKSGQFENYRWS